MNEKEKREKCRDYPRYCERCSAPYTGHCPIGLTEDDLEPRAI